jgi:hypothetical protein
MAISSFLSIPDSYIVALLEISSKSVIPGVAIVFSIFAVSKGNSKSKSKFKIKNQKRTGKYLFIYLLTKVE